MHNGKGMGSYAADLTIGTLDNAVIIDPKTELQEYKRWKCRVCGCTWNNACVTDGEPCYWVEPNLCSACVTHRSLRKRPLLSKVDYAQRKEDHNERSSNY